MVCEGIQARTRSSLIASGKVRGLKCMFSRNCSQVLASSAISETIVRHTVYWLPSRDKQAFISNLKQCSVNVFRGCLQFR